ncbi:MAG: SCP2 sterol-binding domain-containing protein [Candidatus Auribacterota bacterium]
MQYADDFFGQFLPSKMHTPLVEGMNSYSILFSVDFTDIGRRWAITVSNGMITDIMESPYAETTVRFKVNLDSFYKIVSKQISPQSAFFSRQTDIKGNIFEGMKLARILSFFFENHPYTAKVSDHV